jgi:D-arabinan endo alpha-(1,5)-arabinofuranosidase
MSAIPRIVSVSVASAAAIGLILPIGLAPPAGADFCNDAPAPPGAPDAGATPTLPFPLNRLPLGRRPPGANENAPLPKLGQLLPALLGPLARHAAPLRHQAAVIPPNPAGPGNQPPPNAAPAAAPPAPAPPAAPAVPTTSVVSWLNGPNSPNNTLQRFGIHGADLGIMWDNGDPINRQVLIAFGDTFGYCSIRGQHRYNTIFRSQDRDLSRGINVANGSVFDRYSGSPEWQPGFSKQVINSIKVAPAEVGVIPTAGISVGRNQYVNFMSVRDWGGNGDWSTNFSAIAMSSDNGQNWGIYPGTVRTPAADSVAAARYVPGNENFQQGAFVRSGDGYVYSFGTPPGRGGPAFVARVPQGFVPDVTKYQYWSSAGNAWVPNNPSAATPVIPAPVGEMSAQYNTYLKKFLVLYCNGASDVVARTAPAPQGPWSDEQPLVTSGQIPGGIYAPYIHPWSSGKDLYWNLSLWSAYSVMLMHTALA